MSFIDYLASLPAIKLDRLYESHWTCRAVLRSLPPLAKQYVLRLLFVEVPIAAADLQAWVRPDFLSKHRTAIERLEQLRVLLQDSKGVYRLNPPYQKQLREALSTGGGPPRERVPRSVAVRLPTSAELEEFSLHQWEAVLLQLVGAAGSGSTTSVPPNPLITEIFVRARLMATDEGETPRITDAGFRFLLLDTNSQLWEIIREYVASAEERGRDSGQLIGFLLELGFHSVGEPYSAVSLTRLQQSVVAELELLGLLKTQRGTRDKWFLPTSLAASLSASLSESASWQPSEGHLVVETNFRVYAYTTSRLQTEILRLFMRVEYTLPNLVVGTLTRESANSAFACGISAEQIISYLVKHAHPHVAARKPVVPENVTDQVRLWERDRNRIQASPAVLYDDFPSQDVFEAVAGHARDTGGLLWQNPKQRRVVVRADLHEQMRTFIRRQGNAGGPKRRPERPS